MTYIVIDPGHGGHDNGGTGYKIHEKDVVLRLSKLLMTALRSYEGVKVSLTHSDDRYLSLDQRCEFVNKRNADLFISMHTNSFHDSSAHGYESYVVYGARDNNTNAARKQNVIHKHVMSFLGKHDIRDRGKKQAGYYVLRYTKMSAILFENLFITNRAENGLLKESSFLSDLAEAYARGIADAYDLKPKEQPDPEPAPKKEYWRVFKDGEQIGFFDFDSNALQCGYNAAKAGLEKNENKVTITYERVLR